MKRDEDTVHALQYSCSDCREHESLGLDIFTPSRPRFIGKIALPFVFMIHSMLHDCA